MPKPLLAGLPLKQLQRNAQECLKQPAARSLLAGSLTGSPTTYRLCLEIWLPGRKNQPHYEAVAAFVL